MIRVIELRDIYNKAIQDRIAETQKKYHETLEKALIEAAEHGCNAIQITKKDAEDNHLDRNFFFLEGFSILDVGDTWIITFGHPNEKLSTWMNKAEKERLKSTL